MAIAANTLPFTRTRRSRLTILAYAYKVTHIEEIVRQLELRIPGKANADPKASRTAFRDNPEHDSERSDAGLPIVR